MDIIVCPQCGSPEFWRDPKNPALCKCKSCGTEFINKEILDPMINSDNNPAQIETIQEPDKIKTEYDENADCLSTVIIFLIVIGVLVGMGCLFYIAQSNARITTDGYYEISPVYYCTMEETIIYYGEKGENPTVSVQIGEKWQNVPDFGDKPTYFKVVCNSTREYYWGFRFPKPENGQITKLEGDNIKP